MRALAKWSGLKVLKTEKVASRRKTTDSYLIAQKV
jgi:hypothetical protein